MPPALKEAAIPTVEDEVESQCQHRPVQWIGVGTLAIGRKIKNITNLLMVQGVQDTCVELSR